MVLGLESGFRSLETLGLVTGKASVEQLWVQIRILCQYYSRWITPYSFRISFNNLEYLFYNMDPKALAIVFMLRSSGRRRISPLAGSAVLRDSPLVWFSSILQEISKCLFRSPIVS